jgi:hypothetical protein
VTVRSGRARAKGEATGAVKRTLVDYAQRLDVIPALRARLPTSCRGAASSEQPKRTKGPVGAARPGLATQVGEMRCDAMPCDVMPGEASPSDAQPAAQTHVVHGRFWQSLVVLSHSLSL